MLPWSGVVRCIRRWINSVVIGFWSHTTYIGMKIYILVLIFEIYDVLIFLVSGIMFRVAWIIAPCTAILTMSLGVNCPGILKGGVWVKCLTIGQTLSGMRRGLI